MNNTYTRILLIINLKMIPQKATRMCLMTCSVLNNPNAGFFLTGATAGGASVTGAGADACNYDYLAIPGGQNQTTPFGVADRYCGATFPSICSMLFNQ
jgi:hypothetical protein